MKTRFLQRLGMTGILALSAGSLSAADFDWPQWRGPDRTAVSKEAGLLKNWPQSGPKRLWIYEKAGYGYSGPSVAKGKLFTIGTREDSECVLALDADNGTELWAAKIGPIWENDRGGGPRGNPTID
ncbi:MAG TPA: polyvinylalcohol dehydrogenase, partial [Candidatus Binatia bacterium]|nr:polyvinylalcohol dehydrogenase [Candidatus Binatia bacterium]